MTDRPEQAAPTSVPVTEPDQRAEPSPASTPGQQTGLERVRSLCPYLVAVDGDWRTVTPARDHVCSAVDPPAPIALDKQRRLCLVDDHVGCATYLAARRALIGDEIPAADVDMPVDHGLREARTAEAGRAPRAPRWPVPRTAPVVVERGRGGLAGVRVDRSVAQVGLVVLMIVAFGVLAVARLSSDGAQGPAASATPSPAGSVMRSPSPSPAASATSSPSAPVSTSPAPSPSAPAASAATKTYRVRSGDTLSGIATRFGTTVAVLRELNDIADPSLLRVGQLLRLP